MAKALSHYSKLRVETLDTVFKHKDPKAANSLDIIISTPRAMIRNRTEDGQFKSNPIFSYLLLSSLIFFYLYLLSSSFTLSTVKTGGIKRLIVDEADTLFSSDFAVNVKEIISYLPPDPRVLATSATITRQLQRTLTALYPAIQIHMTAGLHAALPTLRQRFFPINQPGNAKMQQAHKIITEEPSSRIIIFCNKLVKAETLHKYLCDNISIEGLDNLNNLPSMNSSSSSSLPLPSIFHGNLPPVQRASIIQKFASGAIRVLICTDLAARGLDTPWVNHVINFDFPRSLQDYLHRAGRTARAGRGGAVTSFVTAKDRALFEYIELAAKQRRILSDPL